MVSNLRTIKAIKTITKLLITIFCFGKRYVLECIFVNLLIPNYFIMKKIFFVFLFLISFTAFSQIERVDQQTAEITSRISHVYLEKIDDKEYNFFYKNMNSSGHEYVKFSFKTLNDSYNLLYEILMEGFKNMPRDPMKIKANGEIVWLKYFKEDGVTLLQIEQNIEEKLDEDDYGYGNGGKSIKMTMSRPLTEEDVTNLFKK